MKNLICLIAVVLLYVNTALAQGMAHEKIAEKIDSLKQAGVDTLVQINVSDTTQTTQVIPDTACISMNTTYLAWTTHGHNYLQRFDDCFTYQPYANVMTEFFAIITKKFNRIKNEEIKPPVFSKSTFTSLRSKQVNETTAYIDNELYIEFIFWINKQQWRKNINLFYLDGKFKEKLGDDAKNMKNESDEYNNSTTLKKLKDLFEKQTAQPSSQIVR